jgi:hypothetical protein
MENGASVRYVTERTVTTACGARTRQKSEEVHQMNQSTKGEDQRHPHMFDMCVPVSNNINVAEKDQVWTT